MTTKRSELQDIADRIASRFRYSEIISEAMLARVAGEATAELGYPCEARFEVRDGRNTLVIEAHRDPEPGIAIAVTAAPPTIRRGERMKVRREIA